MEIELMAITPDSEKTIESAARVCYQSEPAGEVGDLIKKLIKSGHHSVLEHASATFRINGCSRALTHQLVRHRLCSFSQQSQRYVNEKQFDYVIPKDVYKLHELEQNKNDNVDYVMWYKEHMKLIQDMYNFWKSKGLKNEDARFVLPNACCSEIVVTANFREWRTIFGLRCDKHAQWEIRELMMKIMSELYKQAPNVFCDLMVKFGGEVESMKFDGIQ